MDIEKAFESIQNNLIVIRERDHCITQVCPCCGKYKFSAVADAFDCTINELDYCILHSVKDDKVVTIDFKVCSKFRPVPVLSPYWGLEMLRGVMLILKYIL